MKKLILAFFLFSFVPGVLAFSLNVRNNGFSSKNDCRPKGAACCGTDTCPTAGWGTSCLNCCHGYQSVPEGADSVCL